uniref:NADH dehydrogenase subunit 6 n=1 Tax=Cymbiola nobilis TaxID=2729438 RepID=A0A6M3RUM6_9CAEN|nr:NADH dehydrogenase subunit 6 [Cymbiola nobilis]
MTAVILISLAFSSLLILPMMMQPLSLGLVVMMSTLFMCMVSSMALSSWYAYILFLIYVGGLLVMFAYVAALSPNVLFGSGIPILIFCFFVGLLSIFMWLYPFIDLSFMDNMGNYSELMLAKTLGVEMVSPHMISILIGLALVLLVNLIVVVKICYYQQASLRPFSY